MLNRQEDNRLSLIRLINLLFRVVHAKKKQFKHLSDDTYIALIKISLLFNSIASGLQDLHTYPIKGS